MADHTLVRSEMVNIRLRPDERRVLSVAADLARERLSVFVRAAATERARNIVQASAGLLEGPA